VGNERKKIGQKHTQNRPGTQKERPETHKKKEKSARNRHGRKKRKNIPNRQKIVNRFEQIH